MARTFVRRAGARDARGKTAAAALETGPPFLMRSSLTLTIFITRNGDDFAAVCPALPDCRITARSRSKAYRDIKTVVYDRLAEIGSLEPLPDDPIVSVRKLRVDLLRLWEEVDLR